MNNFAAKFLRLSMREAENHQEAAQLARDAGAGSDDIWQHNVEHALRVAAGRWNAARSILLYGEELWKLRGDVAAWWGSSQISDDPQDARAALLLHFASIALQPTTSPIPIPFTDGQKAGEAIIDYLAVAGGPDPIPGDIYTSGLGAIFPSQESFLGGGPTERSIEWQQGVELSRLAVSLLHGVDRPAPRYVGQALTVALPPDLLPRLGAFGVVSIRVYPRSNGMYVAVLDRENQTLAAAWWHASAKSGERNPNTFSPACWLLVHVICSALWHDLCADAVEISAPLSIPRSQGANTARPAKERPERTSRLAILPPPRYRRATWGEGEDAERIRQVAHYKSGDYRRLPPGYEEREADRGFQARQREAAARAEGFGFPAPPPGYTFVKPHVRGAGDEEAKESPAVRIRSRGLFSLMLGVAQQG